jgi:hypothetical protein
MANRHVPGTGSALAHPSALATGWRSLLTAQAPGLRPVADPGPAGYKMPPAHMTATALPALRPETEPGSQATTGSASAWADQTANGNEAAHRSRCLGET